MESNQAPREVSHEYIGRIIRTEVVCTFNHATENKVDRLLRIVIRDKGLQRQSCFGKLDVGYKQLETGPSEEGHIHTPSGTNVSKKMAGIGENGRTSRNVRSMMTAKAMAHCRLTMRQRDTAALVKIMNSSEEDIDWRVSSTTIGVYDFRVAMSREKRW